MKYEVQEFMVSNEQQMENLEEWSSQLEERVLHYDDLVDKSKNELKATMKKEEDQEKQEEEKQKEEEQHEQKCFEDGWEKSWESRRSWNFRIAMKWEKRLYVKRDMKG